MNELFGDDVQGLFVAHSLEDSLDFKFFIYEGLNYQTRIKYRNYDWSRTRIWANSTPEQALETFKNDPKYVVYEDIAGFKKYLMTRELIK